MTGEQLAVVAVFVVCYAGMALGRLPGLAVDRAGIALVAAILLHAAGIVGASAAFGAIDFPTLFILFGLMILSAQFAVSGFYDWCAARIAQAAGSPARLLAVTVAVAGTLSAVLANDVVVFAMTPLLCVGLKSRGLDPRPYLVALAGAANAGSAATIIGNPQNILIGQIGGLDFWRFLWLCGPPAVAGLVVVHVATWLAWRRTLDRPASEARPQLPPLDRWQLGKAVVATVVLLLAFTTPLPHTTGVLAVAGALLISRRMASRRMLGMVDWHLLVLFAGLFVVTAALAATGLPAQAVAALEARGMTPERLSVIAPLALAASNTIGNVPTVMLLLAVWPDLSEGALASLALASTLAGNLLIVGSLANIIVVERAREQGVRLGLLDHARAGVPMTVVSLALGLAWLAALGAAPW